MAVDPPQAVAESEVVQTTQRAIVQSEERIEWVLWEIRDSRVARWHGSAQTSCAGRVSVPSARPVPASLRSRGSVFERPFAMDLVSGHVDLTESNPVGFDVVIAASA